MDSPNEVHQSPLRLPPSLRMRTALLIAIAADIFQMIVYPLFVEGAASPADDMLDLCLGGFFGYLLGWHWEFLPSFLGKLVPGVDLVPLWTLAVANVYRKSRSTPVTIEGKMPDDTPRGA